MTMMYIYKFNQGQVSTLPYFDICFMSISIRLYLVLSLSI